VRRQRQLNTLIGSDGKVAAAYVYGARGEVLQERDADGRVTLYSYDAFLNAASVTTPDGLTTRYASSPLGRPLSETSPSGELRTWSYDPAHRPTGTQYENNGTETRTFDAARAPRPVAPAPPTAGPRPGTGAEHRRPR
jgi:YD repeat-containing protein